MFYDYLKFDTYFDPHPSKMLDISKFQEKFIGVGKLGKNDKTMKQILENVKTPFLEPFQLKAVCG